MSSNAGKVADALDAFASDLALDEADLLEVGHAATSMIVLRTKQGIDVDHKPFAAYSPEYAKERQARGLSTRPDLAVTGHMLGALVPAIISKDEVAIQVLNPLEATKLAAHNNGVDSTVSVRSHSRNTFVDKKGRRVSREEAKRDQRRKNKRVTVRRESVDKHSRHMKLPKREILDIRHPTETGAIEEMVGSAVVTKIEKL